MILAVFLAPIVAVQAEKWLERRRHALAVKRNVFATLMSTRATAVSPKHVEALNLIDILFYGKDKKSKVVREAWNSYRDHLSTAQGSTEATREIWLQTSQDRLISLLKVMGDSLGFDFEEVQIRKGAYLPIAHTDQDLEERFIRRGLADILTGEKALPMEVRSFPFSEDEAREQKEVRELAKAWLEGKSAVRVANDEVTDKGRTSD